MIKQFYQHLGLTFVSETPGKNGTEFLFKCPWCEGKKSFSINSVTGSWKCWKGCGQGFPYQFVMKLMPHLQAVEIFKLLEEFGLGKDSPTAAKAATQVDRKPTIPRLDKNDVRKMSDEEILIFCRAKGIFKTPFLSFNPYIMKSKPIVLLPAYDPTNLRKPNGWIRAGLDGSLVEIKYQDEDIWKTKLEKYPQIAGSNVGLMGLQSLDPDKKTLVFAEGWKDSLAAKAHGYNSVCCSGGAGKWRASWLTVFKDKDVVICFDADDAGVRGGLKAAAEIYEVAASVKNVRLPYEVKAKQGLDLFDYFSGVTE